MGQLAQQERAGFPGIADSVDTRGFVDFRGIRDSVRHLQEIRDIRGFPESQDTPGSAEQLALRDFLGIAVIPLSNLVIQDLVVLQDTRVSVDFLDTRGFVDFRVIVGFRVKAATADFLDFLAIQPSNPVIQDLVDLLDIPASVGYRDIQGSADCRGTQDLAVNPGIQGSAGMLGYLRPNLLPEVRLLPQIVIPPRQLLQVLISLYYLLFPIQRPEGETLLLLQEIV